MLMQFNDLGNYRRARVWWDELPLKPYPAKGRGGRSFTLKGYKNTMQCCLTVELVMAARMVSNYA
ncbi:hypothetical protein D3C73_1056280 [compost metagenome]